MRSGRCPSQARGRLRGYTYIGLVILLAVLSTAAALTLELAQTRATRDAEADLLGIGGEFDRAFASYYRLTPAGQRPFPARLEDLLRDPRHPGIKRHLRRLYNDPLNPGQPWGLIPAPGGGIMGVYSQAAGTPFKQDAGSRALPVLPAAPAGGASSAELLMLPTQASRDMSRNPTAALPADSDPVVVTTYAQWRFGYDPQVDLAARQRIITVNDPSPGSPSNSAASPR